VNRPEYDGNIEDVWRHNQILRHTTKNKGGGKQRKKAQHNIDKYWEDELEEGKVPWNDPKYPLESGWTPAEKNRAKRARTGVEDPNTPQHKISDKDMTRYGAMKNADDTETERAPKGKKTLFGKKSPEHKNLHQFKKFPIRTNKGEEQTIGNVRRSKGTPKPGATDHESNMYQSPIERGDKRTRGGRLDQWKGINPKEEYEYELEESSTGEKMGRGKSKLTQFGNLKIKGKARSPENTTTRRRRSVAAIAKKAGLTGTGKLSHHDIKSSPRDYTTYDSEDELDDIGSTEQDHFIRTYKSPRRAASGEQLISKYRGGKVNPSKDSVRKVRDFKKSMTKAGADKRGRVHTVDIMHRDSEVFKGDKTHQMERGRNFIAAVKDTPNQLKKAGAKKGEAVIGKPSAAMSGEDSKTGKEKRAKLYKKIFGKRSTKKSEKTGMMMGAVDKN